MNNDVKDLMLAKKEKINEWLEYLNSEDDDVIWIQKNRVFISGLSNILYQLQKNANDAIAKKQEQLINSAITNINQRDKENVMKIVNEIKELDGDGNMNKKTIKNDLSQEYLDDNVTLSKDEYEMLKKFEEETLKIQRCDFALIVNSGAVLSATNPNYNNGRIKIEIFDINNNNIEIDGKKYTIKTQVLFNKIKAFISDNLNVLVDWSKKETNFYLDNNAYEGGKSKNIKVKYGQLLINVDGQVTGDLGKNVDEFINYLKELIMKEADKADEDYMMEIFEKNESYEPTPLDEEFEKYCKLYEEKFGKKANIPEPSGTKEFVIECIKKCLQENKDILGDLCYPNFKKDMENGVLYSETKNDLNNDKFVWKEGEIKIAKTQCEFCKYNDKEHPNICSQYPNGKPNEVINNSIKCPKLERKNSIL